MLECVFHIHSLWIFVRKANIRWCYAIYGATKFAPKVIFYRQNCRTNKLFINNIGSCDPVLSTVFDPTTVRDERSMDENCSANLCNVQQLWMRFFITCRSPPSSRARHFLDNAYKVIFLCRLEETEPDVSARM